MSELGAAIRAGDRRALARGITLLESTRDDDRGAALELLGELQPYGGGALRVGVSGPPGAGKSTVIEALGTRLVDRGVRLGVAAIDPSSTRGGGSILGDRTRMEELSRREDAYIRPSPAGEASGGVARRSRETILLIEAWGAEVVLVETVGVGQSEVAVAGMVDQLMVLVTPGAGDELQGIKRGVMELADVIVVNKADGDLAAAAERSRAEYTAALSLMRPRYENLRTPVLCTSATEGTGLDEVWQAVEQRHATLSDDGRLATLRSHQAGEWLRSELQLELSAALERHPQARALAERRHTEVQEGRAFAPLAAREIISALLDEG